MKKTELIKFMNMVSAEDVEVLITDGKTEFSILSLRLKEPEPIPQSDLEEYFEDPIEYTNPKILIKYAKPFTGKNPF